MLSSEQGIALDPLAVALEKECEYLPLIARVEPINVVVGIAREHHGRIPLAVASGGTRRIIQQVLEHLASPLFAAVVTSEDVVHQKPAPDIFWKRRDASACRAFIAPTKTPIWECKRSEPREWKQWTCATCTLKLDLLPESPESNGAGRPGPQR